MSTVPGQAPSLPDLRIADVMHPGVISCDRAAPAGEVARLMASAGVHSVIVADASKDESASPRVWGIVSDLDVLAAITRPGPPATAADLAGEPVITIRPTTSVHEAAEAMVRHRAHHVIVVDGERHVPVGIVSSLDIAARLAG